MKKLLAIIILGLFWSGNVYSEIKTLKCERLHTYVDKNGALVNSGYGSDQQRTLIIKRGNLGDSPYFGNIDVIGENFEHKYKITEADKLEINAIRYFFIEDEDIKERDGDLRKFMKKRKGKLYHISFLKLNKFNTDVSWYKLNIIRSQSLYLIDHPSFASNVHSKNELYRCKE